jgi:copper chaperone CopZ
MENSEVFSFGFDYGPRVIPIEALTYWKLVPVKPEKDDEAPKKEKEQKLELKAKICCPSCIQKVKEELYYKVAGITDIQVDKEKSKIVVVGKVEDRSLVLKKVKKIFKGAKFETKEETKNKDPDDDSGTSSAQSTTTTTKDQFVQYYVPALPPMSTYYHHPDQLWPYYSYPTPPYNYPLITYRP